MLKLYETYKSFPELWLSKIPKHWDCKRIKYLFSERTEKGFPDEPLLVASQNKGVVPKGIYANRTVEAQKDLHLLKFVRVGDFVISLRSFQGGIEYAYYQGIISPAYTVMVPKEDIVSGYFRHLAKSRIFIELLKMCVTGIREGQNIDYGKLKNHLIPVPPREEQDQIVRYLDWKLSETNKLIRAKKKQLLLLNELRKACIDNAVLNGIKPTVTMKESGVYWLGKIPEHWPVLKLKRICRVNASISNMLSSYNADDMVTFLPMESISSDGTINCSEKRRLEDVRNGFSSFARNDIVVAKITPCFENGKGAFLGSLETDIGFGTTELIVLRANEKVLPQYLYLITKLRHFRVLGAEIMTGSAGQKRVPTNFIGNFALGIPDVDEQKEIIKYVKELLTHIDKALALVKKEIYLFDEYRTRLISDVVTGKLDVRDINIPEYEDGTEEMNADIEDEESMTDEEIGEMEEE